MAVIAYTLCHVHLVISISNSPIGIIIPHTHIYISKATKKLIVFKANRWLNIISRLMSRDI